jgi:divalent metal cation (Fe/Co/Zn/Cd) transporter
MLFLSVIVGVVLGSYAGMLIVQYVFSKGVNLLTMSEVRTMRDHEIEELLDREQEVNN